MREGEVRGWGRACVGGREGAEGEHAYVMNRETDRDRDRETERDTERQRQRQTETETDRQTDR